jgi:hypothetical protein
LDAAFDTASKAVRFTLAFYILVVRLLEEYEYKVVDEQRHDV